MSGRGRKFQTRLLSGAALVTLSALAGAAHAEETHFTIPPQPLNSALSAFGKQSGHPMLVDMALVQSRKSPGIIASADPEIALRKLLAGTGLTYRREGEMFTIVAASTPSVKRIAPAMVVAAETVTGSAVEGLVVTAQKRRENIQDVPIAISAFTQDELTVAQVAGGPDLMTQVPNVTFTKTNFSGYSIQIRGIGTQAVSATVDPAVAVAFNNTPFIRNRFFEQEFFDLERIEVLRGPQGTLYGRNATAGVINLLSAKPSFVYESKLSADVANYASTRLEGMVNLPLVEDKAALRLAGAWTKRDGFVTNTLTGEQTDGRDLWSFRASLGIEPTDNIRADLIFEHFEENDDRLRSGKQLCNKDPGPAMIGSKPVPQSAGPLSLGLIYVSQGCKPASLYGEESYQTPNGFALPYYGPAAAVGSPVYGDLDPYVNSTQSRDLREIETHIEPEYHATTDVAELQLRFDLNSNLTLSSETAFARDYIFAFQDFNRFDTTPGVFVPDASGRENPVIHPDGVFCDPQLGCTSRLAAGDLSTAQSQHFSQEFRLSSDFDGPFNFSFGGNFLRYDTEDKYYVFINSLTAFAATGGPFDSLSEWIPGVTDGSEQIERKNQGYVWADPNKVYNLSGFYIDPNNIHNLNDQGRNYFLSRNPYHLLSYAAFGEMYWQATPALKFTGGLRWTVDKKTAPQLPSWLLAGHTYGTPNIKTIQLEWEEPTGRFAVDWKPELSFTDDTLFYASYVHGYKAGGANPPPYITVFPPACPPGCVDDEQDALIRDSLTHPETFDAEFVDAFEIGTKNTFFDGGLTTNLSAFYYDYQGYQISQIVDRSAVNLNFDATVWGAELEIDWRPLENLRFGLKGGYENTRLADGSEAVDMMDRVAGHEGWTLLKPFPPNPSNCVVPTWLAEMAVGSYMTGLCSAYQLGVDPWTSLPYVANPTLRRDAGGTIDLISNNPVVFGVDLTGYQGFNPASAPNNGEGFAKDLSGNELPNAPHVTATLTADWSLPLSDSWLMTLHTDLYYQSEAWTRIFNTDGYDKLKAYQNINFAAIFDNEDSGLRIMVYVKNVLDRDSITGAFLNSDDTGLTTNVFLTEPRLYGVRVTKSWDGLPFFAPQHALSTRTKRKPGEPYAYTLELGGYYGEFSQDHEAFEPPTIALFNDQFPYPSDVQEDIDWGTAGEAKFTYTTTDKWLFSAGVRYGRAQGKHSANVRQKATGGESDLSDFLGYEYVKYFDPSEEGIYNYIDVMARNEEMHSIVDFTVGKEIGLGGFSSTFSGGLRFAQLISESTSRLHARPDVTVPAEDVIKYGWTMHRVHGDMEADRRFNGAGLTGAWDMSRKIAGDTEAGGALAIDFGVGGSVLWGKQKTRVDGEVHGDYVNSGGTETTPRFQQYDVTPPYTKPFSYSRSKSVTVPSLAANIGVSYLLGGVRVSGGYRAERFFDAIDGGVETRKTFDRDINGVYVKIGVGFGG